MATHEPMGSTEGLIAEMRAHGLGEIVDSMIDPGPNFRLSVSFDNDKPESTVLSAFLLDNEAAPDVCRAVRKLEPGQSATFGGGASPLVTVTRAAKSSPRFTRVKVAIAPFDGAEFVTLLIDRKRGTMAIRPARRRVALVVELGRWSRGMLEKQAMITAREKRLARRSRR